VLNVSSLSQLNIHPSGEFAYVMKQDQSASGYVSIVLLFPIDPSGMLQPTGNAQGTYGPAAFPTLLYGISPNGTQIYLASGEKSISQYLERTVNESGVSLAANTLLIVGFEIYTQFTSGGFEHIGCAVSAEVKSAKDLSLTRVCQLPNATKTGKSVTYSSRIVRVNFDNGLTWTPSKESQSENH